MTQYARKLMFRVGGLAVIAAALVFVGWAAYVVVMAIKVAVLEID